MDYATATLEEMDTTLRQWGLKLDNLTSAAHRAKSERMKGALMRITDLRSRRGRAQSRLAELRASEPGTEAWHALRLTLTQAFKSLADAIRTVRP